MLGEHNNNNKTTTTTLSGDASNLTDAAHRSSGNLHLEGGPLLLRQSWLGGKADATDHRDRRDPLPFCGAIRSSNGEIRTLWADDTEASQGMLAATQGMLSASWLTLANRVNRKERDPAHCLMTCSTTARAVNGSSDGPWERRGMMEIQEGLNAENKGCNHGSASQEASASVTLPRRSCCYK